MAETATLQHGAAEAQKHELSVLLKAGHGLVVVETRDEQRVVALLTHVARELGRPLFFWSAARGLQWVGRDSAINGSQREPKELLRHIAQRRDQGIFILADFGPFLDDPVVARLLRELVEAPGPGHAGIVLVGSEFRLPDGLRGGAMRFELKPPTAAEIETMVRELAREWRGDRQVQVDERALKALVAHLAGLPMSDARRLARNAIFDDGVLDEQDLPGIAEAKFRMLDSAGALQFELETERFADVAGLERLKRWVDLRAEAFRSASPPAGLDPPRGVLLMGVQGCGKSLAARAIAGRLQVPLLALDVGALYNRYHGESERNLREALATAEHMAPCVIWIDEIEKGLATGDSDGGTSRRMLATLLTWMAGHKARVFIAATANDVTRLPPELLRKGRFDEIFFVDLPDETLRAEILRIHLRRRDQKPELYDLQRLAAMSEGFSGAELEHAVVAALYHAHAEGGRLSNQHLEQAIVETRPLSVLMAEQIHALRAWARERTVPA